MHEPQAIAAAAARGPRAASGAAREAPAAGRMNVFSGKRGEIFNLCGMPQNMTPRLIISGLRFLRNACVGCAANGPRRHRKRQEFQLMAPQVEILASLREKNRHAGARGTNMGARLAAPCRPCGPLVRAKGVCSRRASRTFGGRHTGACGAGSACEPQLGKSGGQGPMGRCARRPCCPWSVRQRVRLTKPTQNAGACGLGPAAAAGICGVAPALRPAAIGAGFARPAAGLTRGRPAGAPRGNGRGGPLGRRVAARGQGAPWPKPAFTAGTENARFDHSAGCGLLSWGFAAAAAGAGGLRAGFFGRSAGFASSEGRL